MKVVVNNIAASTGGALSILRDFYHFIKQTDDQNEWIFLLSDYYIEETENIKVVIIDNVKKSRLKKLKFDFISGKKIINDLNPDVVFSMQNIITYGVRTSQVLYVHQPIPFQDLKKFSLIKSNEHSLAIYQYFIGSIIKLSIVKSDKVIAQTMTMKNSIIKKTRINADKISAILPNIANITQYKIPNIFQSNSFFYPAFSGVYKNQTCIYDSCEILNKKSLNDFVVNLTIQSNNIKPNITYMGYIDRMKVYEQYNKSTLIFPSYIESCATPIIEAKQMGTLILLADVEYAREIMADYPNAYFFNPFKPDELAILMEKVIKGDITKLDVTTVQNNRESTWADVVKVILNH